MTMKKIIFCSMLLSLNLYLFLFIPDSFAQRLCIGNDFGERPEPELFFPVTDNIDLAGNPLLVFRWRILCAPHIDHYIFRLYKGYTTLASTLILKKELPRSACPFALPAADFEIGQVYTWSLQNVYSDGEKSAKSSSAFKIIKK